MVNTVKIFTREFTRDQRRSERLEVHKKLVALICAHKEVLLFDSEFKVVGV